MSPFDHTKYHPIPSIKKPNRLWTSQQITQTPIWYAVDLRDDNQALLEPMNVFQNRRCGHY